MTDTLDTRAAGMVTAFMKPSEHPAPSSPLAPVSPPVAAGPAVPRATAQTVPSAERFPAPPERGSLDDDDLVPLVGRHTTDTATVDLIGILQAQMQLRAAEAARFAAWEEQMRLIGTDEALHELEKTRLHFTGVIPVQTSPTVVSADSVPLDTAIVPERIERPAPPVVTLDAIPEAGRNVHDERARRADAELLEQEDTVPSAVLRQRAAAGRAAEGLARGGRILVAALTGVAAAVVLAALVVTAVSSLAGFAAVLGVVAVVAASWLGLVIGRAALRPVADARTTSRSAWALVLALLAGTAVGEGLVRSADPAFAWQGYLQRLVQVHGLYPELSLVAGVVAAAVIGFVVVVLVDRARPASAPASA